MALQPAAGARDRNPGEVESNRCLCDLLASVYRLWGYREVDPPSIERLDTLEAGGGIAARELVRLASDEPLGLRPEFTASIARAASTRLVDRPRPLRLWSCGPTFRQHTGDGGDQRLQEALQSGVELLGEPSEAADAELMHLLLAAAATLGLRAEHHTTLLVGHHSLLDAILQGLLPEDSAARRHQVRTALTGYDALSLAQLPVAADRQPLLAELLSLRGEPQRVLSRIRSWLGGSALLDRLERTLGTLAEPAAQQGVRLQLDPTFQPHFDLYDGIVFKLVCQGREAPVAIASGGRYDALVGRFSQDPEQAAGTGFSVAIETIRELLGEAAPATGSVAPWLVAYGQPQQLATALSLQAQLHRQGEAAELCPWPCATEAEAQALAEARGCRGAQWLAA